MPRTSTTRPRGLSFYTGEEIGVSVMLKDADGNVIDSVEVTEEDLNNSKDKEYRTVEVKGKNGKITLTGGTYAQYIPLIDLGLLTISHTETEWEDADGNVHPYTYQHRDNAPANSVGTQLQRDLHLCGARSLRRQGL